LSLKAEALKPRWLALSLLFPGLFLIWGLAPGLSWLDAGELGAAGWELGIAHPPGYPLFSLFHKGGMLLGLGDVAFRGNLASALLGILALALAGACGGRLGAGPLSLFIALILAATSPLFALHALTIEVYTGASLLALAGLWAWIRFRQSADLRFVPLIAFGMGLAAGHHAELRLLIVPLLLALLWNLRSQPRALLLSLLAGLFGLLCLLYLPIRSLGEPWRDWGSPQSLEALWRHLSGARIRAAYTQQIFSLDWESVQLLGVQLLKSPLLLLLGIPGLVRLALKPGGAMLGIFWLLDLFYSLSLNPMGLIDQQNGTPGILFLAVGAAFSLERLFWRLPPVLFPSDLLRREHPLLGASTDPQALNSKLYLLLLGLILGITALSLSALRRPRLRADRGLPELLMQGAALPPETLLLLISDSQAAGWAFAQTVEGFRPDVAVVVRQHIWDLSSMRATLRRCPAALKGWRGELSDLLKLKEDWPLAWEWGSGYDSAARPPHLEPQFPYFSRFHAPKKQDFLRELKALLQRLPEGALEAPVIKRSVAGLSIDLARQQIYLRPEYALQAARAAIELWPSPESWSAMAWALSERGLFKAALEAIQEALRLRPGYRQDQINLIRFALQLKRLDLALKEIEALLLEDSEDPEARGLRGVVRGNQGDLRGAEEDFRAALRRDPKQPEARAGLQVLRRRASP